MKEINKQNSNIPDRATLEQQVEEIDYSALVARLAGKPLTAEQQASCEKFDAVYDATHPECKEGKGNA